MKPVIAYIDDEPMNLTVLQAALPSEWEVHVFDNPLKAIDAIVDLKPWIVISDQKMPGMTGSRFLELVAKMLPDAMRVIVTGYSDEDLIIDSVRKAQIRDYIRKPWDVEDLEHRIKKLIEVYLLEKENREKTMELENKNKELSNSLVVIEEAKKREERLRKELECWVPPFLMDELENRTKAYPCKKSLSVITYDIIESSKLHDKFHKGHSIRSLILKGFTEILLKNGAWRESHAGDSAFAHIGLFQAVPDPCDKLMTVASEFRVFLRHLSIQTGVPFECGIGLHYAEECLIDLHEVEIDYLGQRIKQKSFDTTSPGVDLVHRVEKIAHSLPGSNIIMTKSFYDHLVATKDGTQFLGSYKLKGQSEDVPLYIRPSDKAKEILENPNFNTEAPNELVLDSVDSELPDRSDKVVA